jgi:hypothetical protein
VAFELPITAFRHAPWGGRQLTLIADDWSDADFEWAFSAKPGMPALITLETEPAGTEGIFASYDPDYLHPRTGQVVGATYIMPLIEQASLEALPNPDPVSADIVLYHTLYATPPNGLRVAVCFGLFTIKQGAPA